MAKAKVSYNPVGGVKNTKIGGVGDMPSAMPNKPANMTSVAVLPNDKVAVKPTVLPNKPAPQMTTQVSTPPKPTGVIANKPTVAYNPSAPTSMNQGSSAPNQGNALPKPTTPQSPQPSPQLPPVGVPPNERKDTTPAPRPMPQMGYDPNASAPNNPAPAPRVDPTPPAPARPPLGYDPRANQGGRVDPFTPAQPQTGITPYDPSGGRGTIPPPITPDNPRPIPEPVPSGGMRGTGAYTSSDMNWTSAPPTYTPRPRVPNANPNAPVGNVPGGANPSPTTPSGGGGVQLDDDPTTWTPSMLAELAPPRGTTPQFRDVGNYEPNNAKRQKMLKQNAKQNKQGKKNKANKTNTDVPTPDEPPTQGNGKNKKKKQGKKNKAKVNYNPPTEGGAKKTNAPTASTSTTGGKQGTGKADDKTKLTAKQKQRLKNARNRPQAGTPERPFRNRGNTSSPMRYGGSLRI